LSGAAAELGDLTGKTALITGGNSGIGKATAAILAEHGADVTITSRNRERGESAAEDIRRDTGGRGSVTVADLDLARLSSVRAFAEQFRADHPTLDVLILNAGLTSARREVTEDGFELLFQVNHLGHFLLTHLLLDRVIAAAPSRIVVVASVAHKGGGPIDFDDLQSERNYVAMRVYGRSKLANVLFARELARRLEGTGVTVNSMHPGTVRTGWGSDGDGGFLLTWGIRMARWAFLSPRQAGLRVAYLAAGRETEGRTGGYYVRNRLTDPAPAGRDDTAARRLWAVSEELLGLKPKG
jgi:NAD(P)-dependent dehydrogenase (short-subunit alcohol dehydrogenase family)